MFNPFIFNPKNRKGVVNQFDSATAQDLENAVDSIRHRQGQHLLEHFRFEAVDIVLALTTAFENDFEDETPSEVLDNAFTQSLQDLDNEVAEDAQNLLSACVSDFLTNLGVESSLVQDMFEDDDDIADSAIEKACNVALANLPDDSQLDDYIAEFCFSEIGDDEEVDEFDSAKPKESLAVGKVTTKKGKHGKITYKAIKAVRNGKIVTVNKRVSGRVALSPAQKAHLKTLSNKSHTASAKARREISYIKGLKAGLYKHHSFMGKL